MGRLQDWWDQLTGRKAGKAAASRERTPQAGAAPAPAAPGELSLADSPPGPGASRAGASGSDPYASDAGYSKPHAWERVDHD